MQDSQKFYCAHFYSTSCTGESYIGLSQNLCILQTKSINKHLTVNRAYINFKQSNISSELKVLFKRDFMQNSGSQPGCRGTLGCHLQYPGVARANAFFNMLLKIHFQTVIKP